jgi:cation diffusion facilitator family transporter
MMDISPRRRYRDVQKVIVIVFFLNVAVALAKIIIGRIARSAAISADGFHSLTDGLSNVVGFVAIWIARKPHDEDHPYGHGRFETLAGLAIGGTLLFVVYSVVMRIAGEISHKNAPDVTPSALWVMIGTLVVNVFVVLYERRAGLRLKSEFLVADAMHTLSDVYVTISVLAALGGVRFFGWAWLDPLAAGVVALLILRAAVQILWHGSAVLTDRKALDAESVRRTAKSVPGVHRAHQVRSRGREGEIYVDLHVLVDDHMTVLEGHDLANRVEAAVKAAHQGVVEVMVHVEPLSHSHPD